MVYNLKMEHDPGKSCQVESLFLHAEPVSQETAQSWGC